MQTPRTASGTPAFHHLPPISEVRDLQLAHLDKGQHEPGSHVHPWSPASPVHQRLSPFTHLLTDLTASSLALQATRQLQAACSSVDQIIPSPAHLQRLPIKSRQNFKFPMGSLKALHTFSPNKSPTVSLPPTLPLSTPWPGSDNP